MHPRLLQTLIGNKAATLSKLEQSLQREDELLHQITDLQTRVAEQAKTIHSYRDSLQEAEHYGDESYRQFLTVQHQLSTAKKQLAYTEDALADCDERYIKMADKLNQTEDYLAKTKESADYYQGLYSTHHSDLEDAIASIKGLQENYEAVDDFGKHYLDLYVQAMQFVNAVVDFWAWDYYSALMGGERFSKMYSALLALAPEKTLPERDISE